MHKSIKSPVVVRMRARLCVISGMTDMSQKQFLVEFFHECRRTVPPRFIVSAITATSSMQLQQINYSYVCMYLLGI